METGRRASDNLALPFIPKDAPWWVQVSMIILFWLGPTALLAAFSMLVFTGVFSSPMTENREILKRVEGKLDDGISKMSSRVQRNDLTDNVLIHLQLQTCRNTSRTEIQQKACDDYWKVR